MGCSLISARQTPSLTYVARYNIEAKDAGLRHPSGVVLTHQQDSLWIVSDDKKRLFSVTLDGMLQENNTITLDDSGIEGLTIDPTGSYLLLVREEKNRILKIDLATQATVAESDLSDMRGHAAVDAYLSMGGKNNGLEGITWNNDTGTIFVLKEGKPGLLLELSPDLEQILNHQLLGAENDFHDDDVDDEEIDYSGMTYDPSRSCFWIVSDQAQRLYLYDGVTNQVVNDYPLAYELGEGQGEIVQAEGVTIAVDSDRLYIVSDREARLYVFQIGADGDDTTPCSKHYP
jgi:uncharacterized protein YjiK